MPSNIKGSSGAAGNGSFGEDFWRPPIPPDDPQNLSEEGRNKWARITTALSKLGLLASVDRAALTIYCQAWGRFVAASAALRSEGLIVKAPSGCLLANPNLALSHEALGVLTRLVSEFGLTP